MCTCMCDEVRFDLKNLLIIIGVWEKVVVVRVWQIECLMSCIYACKNHLGFQVYKSLLKNDHLTLKFDIV